MDAGSSSYIFAVRPGCASKTPRSCATWSRTEFARQSLPPKCQASSTISACLTAESIFPIAIQLPWAHGCRRPCDLEPEASPDRGLCQPASYHAGAAISGRHVLVSAVRHCYARFLTSASCTNRHPGVGRDLDANHAWANKVLRQIKAVPGRPTCGCSSPINEPDPRSENRAHQSARARFLGARYCAELAGVAEWQLSNGANLLGGSQDRSKLQHRKPDPAIPRRHIQDLVNIPVTGTDPSAAPSLMASLVAMKRGNGMAVVSHYDISPVIDILCHKFRARPGRSFTRHQPNH